MSSPVRSVLHLDDDAIMHMKVQSSLAESTFGVSYSYRSFLSEKPFWVSFETQRPEVVLLDVDLSAERDGVGVLGELRARGFDGPAIMFSSSNDPVTIVRALAAGATDFVAKNIEESELCLRVTQAVLTHERVRIAAASLSATGATMREIESRISRIVASGIRSVLVQGETGTGKEVVADLFRVAVSQKCPFVAVNSGAISKDLIESELFGYEKGAFTGATGAKLGLLTAADGGWIFLDEVARLPIGAQAALLRTLENGEVRPVGGTQTRKVKVKVLAATNEDLDALVLSGEFRADLLQRLRAYEIFLPPLRNRPVQEMEDLLSVLLERLNEERKVLGVTFSVVPAVRKLFLAYDWSRGNVREMWQVLQSAAVDSHDGLITLKTLPRSFVSLVTNQSHMSSTARRLSLGSVSFPLVYAEIEEELFGAMVDAYVGSDPASTRSVGEFAKSLGLSIEVAVARLRKLDAKGQIHSRAARLLEAYQETL
jgi:DNA-binding NtrC family response regulator